MAKNERKNRRASLYNRNERVQNGRARSLDKLAEFDLFDKNVMPELKKMVLENWPPEKIRRHFAPLMQARLIQEGLRGNIQAMRDTMDRHEGTAVQRQETINHYRKMDKKEFAAMALQKLSDAGIIDVKGRRIKDEAEE